MFHFWNDVVAPVIEAAGARRIVEVGALRGENTERMLDRLGADVELHVIDPLPEFDPSEHERRFAGRYVFHRDLSVNVLGDLPPMDVALIDGDHNWYTVHTELRLLADVARAAGAPFPVAILHDVCWPYGRRDLYYDPDTIPAEHRHPWRRAGIRPGQSELVAGGGSGLNADLANAEHEGGPRNGVMTGLEDFVAAYDRPLRTGGAAHLLRPGHRGGRGTHRRPSRPGARSSTSSRARRARTCSCGWASRSGSTPSCSTRSCCASATAGSTS